MIACFVCYSIAVRSLRNYLAARFNTIVAAATHYLVDRTLKNRRQLHLNWFFIQNTPFRLTT